MLYDFLSIAKAIIILEVCTIITTNLKIRKSITNRNDYRKTPVK